MARRAFGPPVDSAARKVKIQSLNRQLEASRLDREPILRELEGATDPELITALTARLDRATQENHVVQLAIALLERQQTEARNAESRETRMR